MSDRINGNVNKTDNRFDWSSLADFKKLLAEGGIKPYTPTTQEIKKIQDSGFKPLEDVEQVGSRIAANNSFYRATAAEKETLIRQLMMHRGNDSSSEFILAKDEMMQELGKTPMPKILAALEDKADSPNLTKLLVENMLTSFSKEVVGEALDENFDLNPLFLKTLNAGIAALNLKSSEFVKHEEGGLVMSVGISAAAERFVNAGTVEFMTPLGGTVGAAGKVLTATKMQKQLTEFYVKMKVTAPRVKSLGEAAEKLAGSGAPLGIFAKGADAVFQKVHTLYVEAQALHDVKDLSLIVEKMNRLTTAYNKMIEVLASRSHNTIRQKQMIEALEELLRLLKTL